jgi:hypothetical protein
MNSEKTLPSTTLALWNGTKPVRTRAVLKQSAILASAFDLDSALNPTWFDRSSVIKGNLIRVMPKLA